jgi:hypothetical protein
MMLTRRTLAPIACLLMLAALPLCANPLPNELGGDWVMTYYQNPDPDGVGLAVLDLKSGLVIEDKSDAIPPMIGFLSQVFREHPGRLHEWLETWKDIDGDAQQMIWVALWYAGTPEALSVLESEEERMGDMFPEDLHEMLEVPAPPIEGMPARAVSILDMNWGGFYATGDHKFIHKVAQGLYDDGDLAIFARESLERHIPNHPEVLAACRELLESDAKNMPGLKELVKSAEPKGSR